MKYKVAVIILNWNSFEDTLRCISGTLKQTYQFFHLHVIDNGSRPAQDNLIKKRFEGINVHRLERNKGFTGGNNYGIKLAIEQNMDFVWLLNNDCIPDENCLQNLIEEYNNSPDTGILSPIIYFQEPSKKVLFAGGLFSKDPFGLTFTRNTKESKKWMDGHSEDFVVWGTAPLIKTAVLQKTGLFDERFFAYKEDVDLSLRMSIKGFRNRVSFIAKVHHRKPDYVQDGINYRPHYYYYMSRNQFLIIRKYLNLKLSLIAYLRHILNSLRHYKKFSHLGASVVANAIIRGLIHGLLRINGEFKH